MQWTILRWEILILFLLRVLFLNILNPLIILLQALPHLHYLTTFIRSCALELLHNYIVILSLFIPLHLGLLPSKVHILGFLLYPLNHRHIIMQSILIIRASGNKR